MEAAILVWIHGHPSPALDVAFGVSHVLGLFAFCAPIVIAMALWHLRRHDRRSALVWIALGLGAYVLQAVLKVLVERPRPDLWPRLIPADGFSFPSGHAVASATVYPLLAREVAVRVPRWAGPAYGLAAALVLFVGFGRLYLGVHWPTDVLAGWTLGLGQTVLALRLDKR